MLSYFFVGEVMRSVIDRLNKIENKLPQLTALVFLSKYVDGDNIKTLVEVGHIKNEFKVICTKEKEIEDIMRKLVYDYNEVFVFDERDIKQTDKW